MKKKNFYQVYSTLTQFLISLDGYKMFSATKSFVARNSNPLNGIITEKGLIGLSVV